MKELYLTTDHRARLMLAAPGFGLCAVILLASLGASVVNAQSGREIAQKTFPSVVVVQTEDPSGKPLSLGSGFFVREDIVATNLHVIRGAAKGFVRIVGQDLQHEITGVVGQDFERDLALLKVAGVKAASLPLGDAGKMAIGDEVYAVGNPRGLEGTFSPGIVSGIRQTTSETLLQITAPISPGSSGGAVLNRRGEVIGIAVATIREGQNLNFAVPISYLVPLLAFPSRPMPLSQMIDVEAAGGGAIRTPSGAIMTTLRPGTGSSPRAGDRVRVDYQATLTDGTVFDSSARVGKPVTLPLGAGALIVCWEEGVPLMKVGGKSRLVCPPHLAYGDRGRPPVIGPGATLIYEIELLEIVK